MIRLILALCWALVAVPALACDIPADLSSLRGSLLTGANAAREDAGLGTLAPDPRLAEAAQTHACRNAERGTISHRGSWFAGLGRRLRRVDYPYAMAVENLAAGQANATEAMRDWAGSPEHRVNLLAPAARQVGFGVARAEDGWLHWVMIAASPAR